MDYLKKDEDCGLCGRPLYFRNSALLIRRATIENSVTKDKLYFTTGGKGANACIRCGVKIEAFIETLKEGR